MRVVPAVERLRQETLKSKVFLGHTDSQLGMVAHPFDPRTQDLEAILVYIK